MANGWDAATVGGAVGATVKATVTAAVSAVVVAVETVVAAVAAEVVTVDSVPRDGSVECAVAELDEGCCAVLPHALITNTIAAAAHSADLNR